MAAYTQYNAGYVGTLVTNELMKAEHRRLKEAISSLAKRNAPYQDSGILAFTYSGMVYYCPSVGKVLKRPIRNLHTSLHKEMDDYLVDQAKVSLDEKTIQQLCYVLTKNAETSQHIRNMLPDVLARLFTQIGSLSRTIAFEDCQTPEAVEQTNKLLPTIHAYMAGNLLY